MHRHTALISSLLLLSACPGADIYFPGAVDSDSSSTSGPTEPTTSEPTTAAGDTEATTTAPFETSGFIPAFDCQQPLGGDVSEFCDEHPITRDPACADQPPACADVLELLTTTPACAGVSLCDVAACANDITAAPCDVVPASCAAIDACLNPPQEPNCCDLHGEKPGTGLCWAGLDPFCTDCDGLPALCQHDGCGSANVEKCCLSDDGETVACPPPVCSPGFCDDFEVVALGDGLDPEYADELTKICKWSPCFACGEVEKSCAASPCPGLTAKCEAEMASCDCG